MSPEKYKKWLQSHQKSNKFHAYSAAEAWVAWINNLWLSLAGLGAFALLLFSGTGFDFSGAGLAAYILPGLAAVWTAL